MSRTNGGSFTASTLAYIKTQKSFRLCDLIKIEFASGTQYHTNAHKTINYLSDDYLNDHLMSLSVVRETLDLQLQTFTFALSGVDTSNIAEALTRTFPGTDVTSYKAILDTDDSILHAWIQFQGQLESWDMSEGPDTNEISWTCTDQLATYDRLRSRRMSDEEQQIYFSGDRGFEFVGQHAPGDLVWGRSK
jgi:hypothetical protein